MQLQQATILLKYLCKTYTYTIILDSHNSKTVDHFKKVDSIQYDTN